ncbi:MAG: FliH/SctL family protein, partial [Armatimonadota bacterium]
MSLSSRLIRTSATQVPDVFVLTLPETQNGPVEESVRDADPRSSEQDMLARAAEEASRTIHSAKAEAQAIIAAARAEASAIREAAWQEGYAAGRADAREELLTKQAELDQLVEAINQEHERFLSEAEPQLVQLALAIAAKVIEREVLLANDVAVNIARACIRRIKERHWLRIHVNPESVDAIREARQQIAAHAGTEVRLEIAEDPAVDPGGCMIESPSGVLDARIQTRMSILREALEDALNSDSSTEADAVLHS